MSKRWSKCIRAALAATTATVLFAANGFAAQSSSTDEGKRKVKSKVSPAYPELARRMNVTGKVKIEVVIAPDGHVKTTHVVGGHPLLVQACQDAVRDWKFVPGPDETTQVVEFDFQGANN